MNNTATTEWIEFWRKFPRMLLVGLPIITTLETMRKEATAPAIKETCAVFIAEFKKGQSMAGAMGCLPALFSPAMIKLIEVGEAVGDLPKAMLNVAAGLADGSLQSGLADPLSAKTAQPNPAGLPNQFKKEWIEFWNKLARLLDGGLPLVATLELIRQETHQPLIATTCQGLVAALKDGNTFADAMEHFPTAFPLSIINMIKAGEMTGKVDIVARSVADGIAEGSFKPGSPDTVTETGDTTAPVDQDVAEDDGPIIKFVNLVLRAAVQEKASDIHIELLTGRVRIRFRVDGVLRELQPPPAAIGPVIMGRIKIMANMNLAEKNRPQDGRIQMSIDNQPVDMRVSCVPLVEGESVVIRFLSVNNQALTVEQVFQPEHQLATVRRWLQRPQGMVIVNGPAGSGKTTTLYSLLKSLNATQTKIMTVEDPVECRLEGICQQRVNPAIGMTFPAVLRATLRQAPNVVMIGEIRERETAEIMCQLALTGHLVLSSLHTTNGVQAAQRLVDIGLEPYLVGNTLIGVVSQRLFRLICPNCKTELKPESWMREHFPKGALPKLFHSKGCDQCHRTGYRGRGAFHELFEPSSEFIARLTKGATSAELQAEAERNGLVTLRAAGLAQAAAGVTTLEEILAITAGVK